MQLSIYIYAYVCYTTEVLLIAPRTRPDANNTDSSRGYGAATQRYGQGATMATEPKAEGLRIRIRLKAYDHKVIDQSAKQIIDTAIRTGASIAGPVPLPTRRSTFTVVKSPHVYKKGGESFEMRIHKRLIDITNATPKTIDSLQNLSLPAGVDAEIRM